MWERKYVYVRRMPKIYTNINCMSCMSIRCGKIKQEMLNYHLKRHEL